MVANVVQTQIMVTQSQKRHISVRLPTELIRFVDIQAAATFQTRSQYLVSLVADAYQAATQEAAQ